jgi:hypothetical protein
VQCKEAGQVDSDSTLLARCSEEITHAWNPDLVPGKRWEANSKSQIHHKSKSKAEFLVKEDIGRHSKTFWLYLFLSYFLSYLLYWFLLFVLFCLPGFLCSPWQPCLIFRVITARAGCRSVAGTIFIGLLTLNSMNPVELQSSFMFVNIFQRHGAFISFVACSTCFNSYNSFCFAGRLLIVWQVSLCPLGSWLFDVSSSSAGSPPPRLPVTTRLLAFCLHRLPAGSVSCDIETPSQLHLCKHGESGHGWAEHVRTLSLNKTLVLVILFILVILVLRSYVSLVRTYVRFPQSARLVWASLISCVEVPRRKRVSDVAGTTCSSRHMSKHCCLVLKDSGMFHTFHMFHANVACLSFS